MFQDWVPVEYVDFEQPWWSKNLIDSINFGTKVFTTVSVWNPSAYRSTEMLMFNKSLCDTLTLDYPYQTVKDMKWTNEVFLKYIED